MRALTFSLLAALALHAVATDSPAVMIDFDSQIGGGSEGSSVGTIGIATFDAKYAIQGNPRGAFGASAGNDTGNTGSFADTGNVFITSPNGITPPPDVGGFRTSQIKVGFSKPVTSLSFAAADIDWDEEFLAEVFDSSMMSLGSIPISSPGIGAMPVTAGPSDGVVSLVDFGVLTGISQLVITNTIPAGSPALFPGFGIDNLQFTAVPEPTSLALLGMTAIGFYGVRRRRRQDPTVREQAV